MKSHKARPPNDVTRISLRRLWGGTDKARAQPTEQQVIDGRIKRRIEKELELRELTESVREVWDE